MNPLLIYIGWDPREDLAYQVAEYSLRQRASVPVDVTPLKLAELGRILTRPIERRDGRLWCPISQAPMSTEFAISRFAVPLLHRDGWALFCDCDVLFQADVAELFALADDRYAVMVVKHSQPGQVEGAIKMDGQIQTLYSRKNWSSVVLWNGAHPANRDRFTRKMLNEWPGRDLHAFQWLRDREIGELPAAWNHLVDVQPAIAEPKLLHYTLGGPWFSEHRECNHASEWLAELEHMRGIERKVTA
jgi:hypothetical protein